MRMDDRLHIGPLAVDPDVEARAGIRPPAAVCGDRFEVLVDQDHPFRRGLLEAVAELQRPPGPRLLCARGHLAGQAGFVSFARQDAARAGERVARRQIGGWKVSRHLAVHAVDEFLLHFMRRGR